MGSTTAPGTFRVRGGKGWALLATGTGRTSTVGILAHDRVSAGYNPWFFFEERYLAPGTGQTDLRTIRIDH